MNRITSILVQIGREIRNIVSFTNYEKVAIFVTLLIPAVIFITYSIPNSVFELNQNVKTSVLGDENPTSPGVLVEMITLAFFCLISYQIALRTKLKKALLYLFIISFFFAFLYIFLGNIGILLNTVITFIFIVIYWIIGRLCKYSEEKSEVYGLRRAVSQYVSPQIMRRVINNPKSLELGGQTRTMTVLFSDIRNFTAISEKVKAKKLISFVNEYFTSVTKTILEHDGTIDKFAGDSLMAFWNAPLKEPEHAYQACITALSIREALVEFNSSTYTNGNGPRIKTGIGINTGKMIVGHVGSNKRFDYTVIGDDVNTAARLEGLTKMYKVPILLGHNTVLELKRTGNFSKFSIRLLDVVKAKGKRKHVGVYELMGKRNRTFEDLIDTYEDAFALYRVGKFEQASQEFIKILSGTSDYPSKMMLVRCYQFQEDPPNGDWNGVWEWGRK